MKHIFFFFKSSAAHAGLRLNRMGLLFCCSFVLFLAGCKKDLTDVTAPGKNEFSIVLPAEMSAIIKGLEGGDSVKAKIKYPGQPVTDFDPEKFSFMWTSLSDNDTLSTKPYLTFHDFERQDTTLISCLLTVKEKSTGITKHATSYVFITTPTREGWMLLGEKAGAAKLSILTYTPQGYRKFIDLQTELGINLALNGKPVSLSALGSEFVYGMGKYQFLGIVTDQEIKCLRTSDFKNYQAVSNYLTQTLKPDPVDPPVYLEINGESSFVGTKGKDVYYFNTYFMTNPDVNQFDYKILSSYPPATPSGQRFHAARQHVFTGPGLIGNYNRILYDEDSCVFVRGYVQGPTGPNGLFALQLPSSLKGFKMKAFVSEMRAEQDEFTAFLHNPVTQQSYLLQFLSNGILKTLKTIPYADVVDLVASKFIEIDLNTGYLIYTKGNEVLAYDYKMGQKLNLLNFGNETISLIRMEKHKPLISGMPGRVELYKEILGRLVVCTYDPANPDNSGTFRLYDIPLGNQPLIKQTEETGFPKIVDVTFAPIS